MDQNRIGNGAALLYALAAMALGLSWAVVTPWPEAEGPRILDSGSEQVNRPIKWPSLVLAPLSADAIQVAQSELTNSIDLPAIDRAFAKSWPAIQPPFEVAWNVTSDFAWNLRQKASRAGLLSLSPVLDLDFSIKNREGNPVLIVLEAPTNDRFAPAYELDAEELVFMLPAPARLTAACPTVAPVVEEVMTLARGPSQVLPAPTSKITRENPNEQDVSILVRSRTLAVEEGPVLQEPEVSEPRVAEEVEQMPAQADHPLPEYLKDKTDVALLPLSVKLNQQLNRLTQNPATGDWAWRTTFRLDGISKASIEDARAISHSLTALGMLAGQADTLAQQTYDRKLGVQLARTKHGLNRRIATWSAVVEGAQAPTNFITKKKHREDLLAGARWAMTPNGWAMGPSMTYGPRLTYDVQPVRIVQKLEAYEESPSASEAKVIVQKLKQYQADKSEAAAKLTQAVETHYRNANVRVAISQDLVNRLLPAQQPEVRRVNDRIAGAPVSGKSRTTSQLRVQVVPDPQAWRFGIEAQGKVSSQTTSRGGPAKLHSQGSTNFVAKKQVVVNQHGIQSGPTRANATSSSTLVGLKTSYDAVPLLGSIVRSKAQSEYAKLRNRARSEMEHKVKTQVVRTMDGRMRQSIDQIEQRYQQEVLARARQLGLEVTPIEMRTTESRWITRLRVAGEEQLAAHTPRVNAPSDSMLSVQLHESAINNVIEGIGLDGKRLTPAELNEHMQQALAMEIPTEQEPSEDAILHFAPEDALRITFEEGQVKLTLTFREMVVRRSRLRGFKVHVYYLPQVEGKKAFLVQQGTPEVEGRMRTASRLKIHGALGKVLGEDRRIEIVKSPADFAPKYADKLEGLAPTQFVIEDGWIGIAIGPQRTERVALYGAGLLR